MEETLVSIIGIITSAIIMFIVPLTLVADRSDDISQLLVQTATADFVDEVIKTGKITNERYQKFITTITTSRNSYEVDMEIKILDENTAKTIEKSNTYYGYWSFETAAIVSLMGIDDSILMQNKYYPYDLAHYKEAHS